jgi:hypothetical protein
MVNNKRGWIEIIEAFAAMLLIAIVILILLKGPYSNEEDLGERVYAVELSILREIQFNDDLRIDILATADGDLPIQWETTLFPQSVRDKINQRTPEYLNCSGVICNSTATCSKDNLGKRDIYAQSVLINPTAGGQETWRRLKLFCYVSNE